MSWASHKIAFPSERGHLQLQCKTPIATSGFRFESPASLWMRFSRVPLRLPGSYYANKSPDR